MAATILVGSAGRAADSTVHGPLQPASLATSNYSSFCLTCASWYFAREEQRCTKCGEPIFRWVLTSELKHFRSRSSLEGF